MNCINIYLSFLTNFRPSNLLISEKINFFRVRKDSKIILRNFFLFLFLIKYLNNRNKTNSNQSIWIRPSRKKIITILKAPYKNKLARNQLLFKRFYFNYKLRLNLTDKLEFSSVNNILEFIKFFKNFNFFLESNLVYQYKTRVSFNFFLKNFFLFKN